MRSMSWHGAWTHSLPLIGDPWKAPPPLVPGRDAAESSPLLPPSAPAPYPNVAPGAGPSPWPAAALLLQNYCNAGALFLPYCAWQAGLPSFLLLLAVAALLNLYTTNLLLWCTELTALSNPEVRADSLQYDTLVRCVAGRPAHRGFLALRCLDLAGLMVVHLVLAADGLPALLATAGLPLGHRRGTLCAALIAAVLPLALARDPRASLWAATLLPMAAALLGLVALGGSVGALSLTTQRTAALCQGDGGIAEVLPILLFCCLPHFSVFSVYTVVAGRNLHTMMAALQSALLTAPLCYVAWAVAAGFAWTPTPASLLLALGGSPLAAACQFVACVALLLTLPALGAELHAVTCAAVRDGKPLPATARSAVTAAVWGAVPLAAAQVSQAVWLCKALGVTTSLALGGLIPLGLYLRLHRQTRHVAYLEHGAAWLPSPGVARLALGLTGGAGVLFAIPLLL